MFIKLFIRHSLDCYKYIASNIVFRTFKTYSLSQVGIKASTDVKLNSDMTTEFSDVIYKSVSSILETLNRPENLKLDSVRQLIAIYNRIYEEETAKQSSETKYPLIVLEGLDGCGKSTITKRLANTLNAQLCGTPPQCLMSLRPLFDGDDYKKLRPLFYALGNYIAALEMKTIMQRKTVVLDRFWHSTSSYAIAQSIEDNPEKYILPPIDDDIYTWPKDLLYPDKVIFLCVNEAVRLQRLGGRTELTMQENLLETRKIFRDNVVASYNRMFEPKVLFINGQLSKGKVEKEILKHLQELPVLQKICESILNQ